MADDRHITLFYILHRRVFGNLIRSDDNSASMYTKLPHISFQFLSEHDRFLDNTIVLIHGFEFFRHIRRLKSIRNTHPIRDQTGELIRLIKRQSQSSCGILKCGLRSHLHIGTYRRYLFASIFFFHIFDDFLSLHIFEIDIKIGHTDTRRIEESFKKQSKLNRIHVRNSNQPRKE